MCQQQSLFALLFIDSPDSTEDMVDVNTTNSSRGEQDSASGGTQASLESNQAKQIQTKDSTGHVSAGI